MSTTDNVKIAVEAIRKMNVEQLREVVDAVNARRSVLTKLNKRKLAVGSSVEFTTRDGKIVQGNVTKINIKNILLLEETPEGRKRWRVAASPAIDPEMTILFSVSPVLHTHVKRALASEMPWMDTSCHPLLLRSTQNPPTANPPR